MGLRDSYILTQKNHDIDIIIIHILPMSHMAKIVQGHPEDSGFTPNLSGSSLQLLTMC